MTTIDDLQRVRAAARPVTAFPPVLHELAPCILAAAFGFVAGALLPRRWL